MKIIMMIFMMIKEIIVTIKFNYSDSYNLKTYFFFHFHLLYLIFLHHTNHKEKEVIMIKKQEEKKNIMIEMNEKECQL